MVPQSNNKTLTVNAKDLIHSIERVITVLADRKEGKIALKKDQIQLFVNSSSGDGRETLKANYNAENLLQLDLILDIY